MVHAGYQRQIQWEGARSPPPPPPEYEEEKRQKGEKREKSDLFFHI